MTASLNLQVASSEQAMESRRLPLIKNMLQWRTEFHSTVQMALIHCMEQSLYIRCAVANSSVWLVLRRYANTMTWLPFSIKRKRQRNFEYFFLKLLHRLTHNMYTAPTKGGVFLPHFTVWSASAMLEREAGSCLFSTESNSLPLLQGMRPKRLVVFVKKTERKKEDYSKRHGWGRAGSLPHYPLETTQCWRILSVANLFSYWATGYSGLSRHVVG